MNELEEQLSSILSDPEQMEKIAGLARSLMGSGESSAPHTPPEVPGFDASLLQKMSRLMQSGGEGREQALLKAMEPYLSEKRRGKLDRALQLAKLARIARFAIGETGGGDHEAL